MAIGLRQQEEFSVITLNRPDALNALNAQMIHDIADAIDQVATSDSRALLFVGEGDKAFCAGADIKELRNRSAIDAKRGAEFGQRTFAKLDTLPIPSVAVINGFAFGGGLELALACTFRIATPYGQMGLPEVKLGLIPGYGGTQRLPRVIGETRALEMVMTGRTIDADEALDIGLISRVTEGEPVAAGIAFAREFTCYSLPALALAREAVMRAGDTPVNEGLKIEAELNALSFQSEDAAEGMAAFTEKREAKFKDV